MSTLTELIDSRESRMGRGPAGTARLEELTLHYRLEGTTSDVVARALVEGSTPTTYNGLVRGEIQIDPELIDTVTGSGAWNVTVDYLLEEGAEPATGDSIFSFDTGGGTTHLTQSFKTIYRGGIGAVAAPDFKGTIGQTQDNIEGVNITTPIFRWSERHYLPDAQVTLPYCGKLHHLTGKTNDAPYKGLDIGECLFLGASGAKRGEDDWEITFSYAGSENKTNWLPPGLEDAGFAAFDKKGWDYLWLHYDRKVDAGPPKRLVLVPDGLYIEQVYEEGDFADLGIGS